MNRFDVIKYITRRCDICEFLPQRAEMYTLETKDYKYAICVRCFGCGNFYRAGTGLEILSAQPSVIDEPEDKSLNKNNEQSGKF